MELSIERFLILLKEFDDYGLSLKSMDSWENKEEFSTYRLLFLDTTFYRSRQKYWEILQSFLNKTLTIEEFCNEWGEITRVDSEQEIILEQILKSGNFEFNEKSFGFFMAIHYFDLVMFEFNPNENVLIQEGMTDEMYRTFFQENLLPRIAPYCEKS